MMSVFPTSYTGTPRSAYTGNPIHDQEHIPMIYQMICDEIQRQVPIMIEAEVRKIVPQMAKELYMQSIDAMMSALTYDIETCVQISFSDMSDMFSSSKARKFVSDAIIREIRKSIGKMKFNIDL